MRFILAECVKTLHDKYYLILENHQFIPFFLIPTTALTSQFARLLKYLCLEFQLPTYNPNVNIGVGGMDKLLLIIIIIIHLKSKAFKFLSEQNFKLND